MRRKKNEKRKINLVFFCFSVITSLASTLRGFVSPEENLSPRKSRRTMTMGDRLDATVVLSALRSDGAVVDSRLFLVMLDRLVKVEVG
jgi:hypothetical protein